MRKVSKELALLPSFRQQLQWFRNPAFTLSLCITITSAVAAENPPVNAVDFAHEVLPILKRSCYTCHSGSNPDSGYLLDHRTRAHSGGESRRQAIVPHKPDESSLFIRVSSNDADKRMPPEDADVPSLTSEEIETLRRWIQEGPMWPDEFAGEIENEQSWWSLQRLTNRAIPSSSSDVNPIDVFVAEKHAEHGLDFSPEADPRTLFRRTWYSLTGLPPTTDDIERFVRDESGYEAALDELLSSPRYGEHWARHWLDIANYADTHGNDHDYFRPNAWPYRDYVIASLNEDKPYRRFVQE